jgi:hypothetical protein
MKDFTPTAESHGFSPNLLWSGLRSGCRATKSRRSRSEAAKLIGATGRSTWRPFGPERLDMSSSTCLKAEGLSTGLPAVFLEGLPVGLHRRHR